VPVDLSLDPGENVFPDVARHLPIAADPTDFRLPSPAFSREGSVQSRKGPMESGMFSGFASEKPPCSGLLEGPISENIGFSTFFSTTVENFGGRPYGRRRKRDCNIGLLH
jgi:hypothetical protein